MAESSPKPKLRPKKSIGQKVKDFADKYNLTGPPTEATKAARDRFLSRDAPSRQGGLASLASTNLGGLSNQNQYKENLRRYEEYMKNQQPKGPEVTPEMRSAALDVFESQRGAGQMPYYMAAAAQSQDPDMSPAFQYAAQNYATLGGSQRLGPRPMEMMSVAERRQINDMAQGMADQQVEEQRRAAEEQRLAQEALMKRIREQFARGSRGKGGAKTVPQQGGRFNSMEELMEYQNQNPTMNLMGEYRRLKALEAQQSPEADYQAGMDMVMRGGGKGGPRTGPQLPPGMVGLPRTPDYGGGSPNPIPYYPGADNFGSQMPSQGMPRSNFASILASRFGGFGS